VDDHGPDTLLGDHLDVLQDVVRLKRARAGLPGQPVHPAVHLPLCPDCPHDDTES
jgi:hypothetical protein